MTKIAELEVEEFSCHLNSIDPSIQFTSEGLNEDSIPFLDTRIHILDDGSTKTTVYRKPTHTDQYLNFSSNHHLEHKRSVVRTLLHRADKLVSEEKDRQLEVEHVKSALRTNGYPEWMFKIPAKKVKDPSKASTQNTRNRFNVGLPYIRGISERLQRAFKQHGVNMFHKPFNSLRSQLTHVKDTTESSKKCGVIYHIKCQDCAADYIGETARALGTRVKEHTTRSSSAIFEHCDRTGHKINTNNIKVIDSEAHNTTRKIKEAIHIKQKRPRLNRDGGMDLPPVYDALLLSRELTKSRGKESDSQ